MSASVGELFERAERFMHADRRRDAERMLRRALVALGERRSQDGVTRARLLTSLAAMRGELGHTDEGLRLLEDVERSLSADDPFTGTVLAQRGLLLMRAGRLPQAAQAYAGALTRQEGADPTSRARLANNHGSLQLLLGRLPEARREYLRACQDGALPGVAAPDRLRAVFNLAYLDYLGGDLVAALAGLDALAAEPSLPDTGLGPEISQTRALILAAAGLLADADAEFARAEREYAALPSPRDVAESRLTRAAAALADQRPRDALRLAGRAGSSFTRRGTTGWALVAELTGIAARLVLLQPGTGAGRAGAARLAERAAGLATRLADAGLGEDARVASLVAAAAYLAAGRPEDAERVGEGRPTLRRADRLTTRLRARQVRADLAAARGDRSAATRELAAGMAELHAFQASLGSLELQAAVAQHGRALARRGMAAAVTDGGAARVFAWAERTRALASRLPVVRPPADERAARVLEELRFLRAGLREGQLAGHVDRTSAGRVAQLERQVRERSWAVSGSGRPGRPIELARVREALSARAVTALVAHVVHDGELLAVVVTPGGARLTRLGPAAPVLEATRRARADLDVLAGRGYPERMRAVVRAGLARTMAQVGALVWDPLAARVPAGPVVLVPAGSLTALPWGGLPGLRGRPVTVARSASAWVAADPPAGRGRVVVAAGPGLERADEEARAVADLWGGATLLRGAAATGPAVLAAADGAGLLHVAAHGAHEPRSPLFSALRLADGPLFGHDVSRAAALPATVVLSACELGEVALGAGEEVLGMTAALLHAGTRTVIAGVARVGDDVACSVMPALHAGLVAGLPPAAALAAATADHLDAPFVCFGAG